MPENQQYITDSGIVLDKLIFVQYFDVNQISENRIFTVCVF